MKRDIYAEIKAIKQRDEFQHGWRLIHGLKEKVKKFEALYQSDNKILSPFLEYLPVTTIACFESYFRIKVRDLLGLGEPYFSNSKRLVEAKNLKIELFDFARLSSDEIKPEEIIAHAISFSNLEAINIVFSTLLSKDFFAYVKDFTPNKPNANFHEIANFFQGNSNAIFRDVACTYELRHIYCHEFNPLIEVTVDVLLRCIQHCISFLEMVEVYFNEIFYPNPKIK